MSAAAARFTAFSARGIPLAHAATSAEALQLGNARGRVAYVVLRAGAYPFEAKHVVWTRP